MNKYWNLFLCLLVLIGIPGMSISQTTIADRQQNNILPHSPEAEAMAKYTALPVTLYTGLAEVSVPIYQIKGKNLTVPVALSYNYNGFKPAEVASYVGLGWSVQGGGVITRIVKGRVDHEETAVVGNDYDDFVDVNVMTAKQEILQKLANNTMDGEPDLYVFNCNGLSGKFIILKGKAYLFPHQNIRVEKITNGFLLTSVNGDRYYFTTTETTHHHSVYGSPAVPDHVSSWYITQIVSADLADTVNYGYNTYFYHQPPVYAETYTIGSSDGSVTGGDIQNWQVTPMSGDYISDAKVLTSISHKNTYIGFNLDSSPRTDMFFRDTTMYPLLNITVSNLLTTGGTYRSFTLQHAYYNGKLNLTGVNITGTGGSGNVQHYSFEYENQDTTTNVSWWNNKSIDKWGYYNGANNIGTMLFTSEDFPRALYPYGNRSVNFGYCKTNILKKMTYPTGGYTVFDYEPNQDSTAGGLEMGPGVRVQRVSIFDNLNTGAASLIKEYTYNNPFAFFKSGVDANTIRIHGSRCAPASGSSCSLPMPIDKDLITYQTGIYSPLSELINTPFYYRNVTEVNRSATGNGRTQYVFNSFGGEDPEVYLYQKTDQGYIGSSYVNLQQVTNTYDITDKFTFIGVRAALSDQAYTPNECFSCAELESPDPTQPSLGQINVFSPQIMNTWVSAYKTLQQTSSITWDNNGSNPVTTTASYYYDNPDEPYPTRLVTTNSKGEQITTHFKYPLDYTPTAASTRTNIDTVFGNARYSAMGTYGTCYSNLILALSPYQTYYSNSGGRTSFNSILSSYSCETDFKSNSSTVYANRDTAWSQYYAAINTAQSGSTVSWQQAVYWMLANNMLSPVIEKYITIHKSDGYDYLLSASRNEYSLVNGVAALTAVSSTEINTPILYSSFLANTDSYYHVQETMGYDSHMNLVFKQKSHDLMESYLWGYNNQYPVAAVSNASPSSINGYAVQTVLDNPASDADIRTELDKVRTAMASSPAMVTTYTYSPIAGVTSITDKSGRIIKYEYDDFWRINIVRDQDNNILKKYCYTIAGQAYTCDGSPIYYNAAAAQTFTKNDCGTGGTPSPVTYSIPAGRYLSLISTADADSKAAADISANGQEYANTHGYCIYYNSETSVVKVKNNCVSGTPDTLTYTVPAGRFNSTVSKAVADSLAQVDMDANAQNYANSFGGCSNSSCGTVCTGVDKKCINGACETGYKVYTSSDQIDSGHWVCTYHYEFSDGSWSVSYTEDTHTSCTALI